MASAFDPRHHVGVRPERVTHVSSTDFPGFYPDEDHTWNLERFTRRLKVNVKRLSRRSIEFDLVGVDASIANSLRRILIAEIPTIAIEYVYVWNNTSVMQDEVLSHRLGLIPLDVEPSLMEMKENTSTVATDRNTIVFKLQVECRRRAQPRKPNITPNSVFPHPVDDDLYENSIIRSGDLTWIPQGEQATVFAQTPPAPTNPNIVLMKLRPGQELDMELHAVKGVGKDHAKFSPVGTASYRLLPKIILNPSNPVPPQLAEKFAKCFAPGVINIDPRTKTVSVDEENVRKDTVSREVLRHPEFEGMVDLARVRDHFIFNVESEGPYEPRRLPIESIRVMREKIATLRRAVQDLIIPDGRAATEDVQMTSV